MTKSEKPIEPVPQRVKVIAEKFKVFVEPYDDESGGWVEIMVYPSTQSFNIDDACISGDIKKLHSLIQGLIEAKEILEKYPKPDE